MDRENLLAALRDVRADAVVLTTAAIADWKRRPTTGWHTWFHFPAPSALTAAGGMILVNGAHWGTFGSIATADQIARIGGFAIAVAAALAQPLRYRLVIAVPLGIITSVLTSVDSTGALGGIYITAVTLRWLQRLWQITYQPATTSHSRT